MTRWMLVAPLLSGCSPGVFPTAPAPVQPPPSASCTAPVADHVLTVQVRPSDYHRVDTYAGNGSAGSDTGSAGDSGGSPFVGSSVFLLASPDAGPLAVSPGDTVAIVTKFPLPFLFRYPSSTFLHVGGGWYSGAPREVLSGFAPLFEGNQSALAAGQAHDVRVALNGSDQLVAVSLSTNIDTAPGERIGCVGAVFEVPATVDGIAAQPGTFVLDEFTMESYQSATPYMHMSIGPYPPLQPEVALLPQCPGTGSVVIGGATANQTVVLMYGATAGASIVPTGRCAGTPVGVADPVPVLVRPTSAYGEMVAPTTIPPSACGGVVQALDVRTCAVSEVVSLQ